MTEFETKTETKIDTQIQKIRFIDDIKAEEAAAAAKEVVAEEHHLPQPDEINTDELEWSEIYRQGQANPRANKKKKLGWSWIIIVLAAIAILWLQFGVDYREGDPHGLWSCLTYLL